MAAVYAVACIDDAPRAGLADGDVGFGPFTLLASELALLNAHDACSDRGRSIRLK
jgi:hypothetical protein